MRYLSLCHIRLVWRWERVCLSTSHRCIWPGYISDLLKRVDSLCKLIYKDAKKVEGNESNKESAMQSFWWYHYHSRNGITAANHTSSSRQFMASTISSQMARKASSTESTITDLGQWTSQSSSLLPSSGFISTLPSYFSLIPYRPFIPNVPTAFPYAKPTRTPSPLYTERRASLRVSVPQGK